MHGQMNISMLGVSVYVWVIHVCLPATSWRPNAAMYSHMKFLDDEQCIVYLLNYAMMCGLVGAHVLEEHVAFQSSTLNMAASTSSNISFKLHCITSQNSILLKFTAERISGRTLWR